MTDTHDLRNQWYDEPKKEIEKVKAEIKVLEKKLSFLEELSQTKTPCEEAYKRVYGFYPETYEDSWSAFQDGYIASQKDYKVGEYQEPEDNEWKSVALRFGEQLASIGPCGYYDFTPTEWIEWALNAYEKTSDDYLKLLENERVKVKKAQEPEIPKEILEAYKKWTGEYPSSVDDIKFCAFRMGYHYSLVDTAIELSVERVKVKKAQEPEEEPAKDKVSLYKRFVKKDVGSYGCLYYGDALKVVKEFFIDEAVIENQDHEYITFTLQKSLLEVPND